MIRSTNDSVVAYSGPRNVVPTPSTSASNRPPASAPETLPRPPRTHTTKALPRKVDDVSGEIG
jgi:hypothetical protein